MLCLYLVPEACSCMRTTGFKGEWGEFTYKDLKEICKTMGFYYTVLMILFLWKEKHQAYFNMSGQENLLLRIRLKTKQWKIISDLSRRFYPIWEIAEFSSIQFSSVQLLSCVWLFATPWTAAHQASLSITNSRSLLKLMSFESVMPSNHLILCRSLLLLPSIFPGIRIFSNESALCIRWPKYWHCSFRISPSNEHSGLISIRMDRLDVLAVQGTLEESSPTPQFKNINYLVLSFLYSPTLASIHDYWKNHSFDKVDLCWQNNVSAF